MSLSRTLRLTVAALVLLGIIVLGVLGLMWQPTIDEILRPEGAETTEISLYFSDGDAQCLVLERRVVRAEEATPEGILAELARGPRRDDLWATVPEEARVLSITIEDGLAVVDYSEELRTHHWGGSAGEILTVSSIVDTLGQVSDVERVQILLEGERPETLVGHLTLSDPMSVAENAGTQETICFGGVQ